MFNKELILTLLNLSNIGRKTINKLILNPLPSSMDPELILSFILKYSNKKNLNSNINHILIAKTKSLNIIDYCEKNNIQIMTILDDDFPLKLKIIPDNPVILFFKGNKNCITNNKSVAIIGTRTPTLESQEITRKLTLLFSNNNYIIVSGLAYGIDYNAHLSTVKNHNKTVAVLPSGISNIYPKGHRDLCDEILHNDGCILSEYFPYESAYKNHFIERDRLQSAISLGVVVVECDENSGTMHTVNFAKEHNKIIGCFKHKNINLNCRDGNKKLLKDKNTLMIDNNFDINHLDYLLKNKLFETNNIIFKLDLPKEQISFKIN